jgi:hypothetical protein
MIRGIDHLVIATEDPDAAAVDLEETVGLRCTGGGRHEGLGTRNRIAWLADGSYLELIGIDDADRARTSPVGRASLHTLETHGPGLATYALRVDDLPSSVAGLQAAGSSFGPPQHGSRLRDDGEVVEWRVAFPDGELGAAATPFLIEHVYSGAEWGPSAMEERARFAHPIGSPVLLARLDLAVADPPSQAADLHAELELDFWAVADLAVADVGPHVLRLVPSREMAVPAVVTLGAAADAPRTAELFGLRFDVEHVDLPVPELTSGRG